MNKTIKYGLILTIVISIVNLTFLSLSAIINHFLVDNRTISNLFIILASIISSSIISYFIIASSPILKEYLNTFRRLLRLESLSHPLMVRFSHEAPGTYHHTLTVANIASRAAKNINADSLLTRVGAYYHDIGKINNADYFIENQSPNQNAHDEVDPQQSARIIIDHVLDGIKLAEENRLPQEVINFIKEHHGTSTVEYFYQKAKNEDQKTKKTDFKYPGPKPQSPETAIVMLADILEASVKALSNPTQEDIKNIINQTFEAKQADGQLDNAGLNANQITKIRKSFQESLTAIYHNRIQYPKKEKKNAK